MIDPKDIVREGYNTVSHAYRGDGFCAEGDPCYGDCVGLVLSRLGEGSQVLDLGCGCGVPAARDLASQHHVTGVDISPVQISRARSLVPTATFICADMTTLNFPAGGFDAIISLYAIIHVPLEEQLGLFGEMSVWLKPGDGCSVRSGIANGQEPKRNGWAFPAAQCTGVTLIRGHTKTG